jgi:hypothetical protein
MARSLLLTSAQVILYVNGLRFGRVTGFSWTSDTPRRKIHAVDAVTPFELGMTVSSITGTLSVLRVAGDGAAEGAGMVAPVLDLSREKYFHMLLVDITTGFVVFQADFCSLESQQWTARPRSYLEGSLTFSALTYNNEVRPLGS